MSTHHRTIRSAPLILALVLAGACSDAPPLAPEPASGPVLAQALSGGAMPARPLTQRSWGTMAPVGLCAVGPRFQASGEGRASHVGRFDIELDWCMDALTGVIVSGYASVESRGGHVVAMELTGQALSPSALLMDADIVGGTGRFADASGALAVEVSLAPNGTWRSSGEGWIAY